MIIYYVRHGQTDANLSMINGDIIQEDDAPLNQTGLAQAEETAKNLKDMDIDIILSSPYKRALKTAEIINQYHELPIKVEINLRERDGKNVDEKSWHDAFDFDKDINLDGESVREFFERIYAAIDGIKDKYVNKNVLIVAHGGVHHAFNAYFNNLEWKGNLRISGLHNAEYRKYEL